MGVKGPSERGATMREINNQNNLNFPKVEVKKETVQSVEQQKIEEPVQQAKSITENLALAPEAIIGRSQVQMSGINKLGGLEEDMKAMLENPEAIKKAVNFFDIAYSQLKAKGSENPYEKAAVLTNAFKEDFLK